MDTLDLLIQNATCLLWLDGKMQQIQTNVGIKQGKISWIRNNSPAAKRVLNAKGLHLLPGVIDSQVHFREPGMTQKEDLETGTKAAVLGGVTTIFEMPNTVPATTTKELFLEKLNRSKGRCWTNYAFYIGGSPENIDELANLETLPGCCGIKVFMGSSTGSLLVEDDPTLEKIFRSGRRRITLHSEDEFRLRERKHFALESNDVKMHPVWRDPETALRSTQRLLALSKKTNRPVHILHISTEEEMQLLLLEKEKKWGRITVEVLPNHLTLSAPDCYKRLGTLAQQNPPIRDQRHQDALWQALNSGVVDVIGSDHAPHTLAEKSRPYPESPSGTPGVQTLVPIMLNHVSQNRLTIEKLTELICESPRHIFGCFSKGRIELGLDADFTLVDLKMQKTIENSWMASRSSWSPFDGMKVKGWPLYTIVGGNIVVAEEKLIGSPIGQPVDFQVL